MKNIFKLIMLIAVTSSQLFAQQTPGNIQKEAITLLGGIAHIGMVRLLKIVLLS